MQAIDYRIHEIKKDLKEIHNEMGKLHVGKHSHQGIFSVTQKLKLIQNSKCII